ncbi:MAG: hypothetical protein ACOY0T_28260 [Myxococcota bacterium]
MASPAAPGSPPPPPRRTGSVSGALPVPTAASSEDEESPDSDSAPTVVRSEPPPRPVLESMAQRRESSPPGPVVPAQSTRPPESAEAARPASQHDGFVPPPAAEPQAAAAPRLGPNVAALFKSSGERVRQATRQLSAGVGSVSRRAVAFLDVHDGWLPASMRGKVRGSVVVLSGSALTAVCALSAVMGMKLLSSTPDENEATSSKPVMAMGVVDTNVTAPKEAARAPVAAAAPAPQRPTSVEQSAAAAPVANTAPALASAEEGSLLLNAASNFASEGRDGEAIALVDRALLRNPELRSDERVGNVLRRTAHSDDKAAASATFALLEGPMGERGAELIYEISLVRVGNESARKRAQSWLRSKQFTKNAALPLFIVVKLRQAKTCEDKHALLGLAAGGGKQTLDYLRELQAHTTCAPDDLVNCYPCMRADNRLSETIATLEKRFQS